MRHQPGSGCRHMAFRKTDFRKASRKGVRKQALCDDGKNLRRPAKGFAEGFAEGFAKGFAEGFAEALRNYVRIRTHI